MACTQHVTQFCTLTSLDLAAAAQRLPTYLVFQLNFSFLNFWNGTKVGVSSV